MGNPTYILASRQHAIGEQLAVVAHNLANMNTASFKAERLVFAEVLQTQADIQAADNGLSFTQEVAGYTDFTVGSLTATGNSLDVGIADSGFFTVQTAAGDTRYTRNGQFSMNALGQLATSAGDLVLGEGGAPLTLGTDAQNVAISGDGVISTASGVIGKLEVVDFADPQALTRAANGLYDAGDQVPTPAENPRLAQGMMESSNVSSIVEMTRLIDVSRQYQQTLRLIQTEHQRLLDTIKQLSTA